MDFLRSLHTESEISACCKINTTSRCDSKIFVRHKKNRIRFNFFRILIGKDDEYEKYTRNAYENFRCVFVKSCIAAFSSRCVDVKRRSKRERLGAESLTLVYND